MELGGWLVWSCRIRYFSNFLRYFIGDQLYHVIYYMRKYLMNINLRVCWIMESKDSIKPEPNEMNYFVDFYEDILNSDKDIFFIRISDSECNK